MPETRSFEELAAAGWSEADIDWENSSEAAVKAVADGDIGKAKGEFAHAVRIANEHFSADDPRLGTSLANHAAALVATGEASLSGRSAMDAARIWCGCDGWVARMTAPRVARSSLFHLRMEQRHRATYEARWRLKWAEFLAEARGQLEGDGRLALAPQAEAVERLARWRRERPAMLNDTRKLIAAVILLVARMQRSAIRG